MQAFQFESVSGQGTAMVTTMAKRSAHSQPSLTKRFDFDVDDNDFEDICLGFVPVNTTADTDKCLQLFSSWADARGLRQVPEMESAIEYSAD